jgi:hypothetical protein
MHYDEIRVGMKVDFQDESGRVLRDCIITREPWMQVGTRSRGGKVNCEECPSFEGRISTKVKGEYKYWFLRCKVFGVMTVSGRKNQDEIPSIHCHRCPMPGKKKKHKNLIKSALKVWKEENEKTAAEMAEMFGISKRQVNRYLAGDAMPPWLAVLVERFTGIPRMKLVFTPKVMERSK